MNTDGLLDAIMVVKIVSWFCGRTSFLGDVEILRSEASRYQQLAYKLFSKIKVSNTERGRETESKNDKMLTVGESRGRCRGI